MAGPQSIAMLNGSNILISDNYINGDGGFLGGVYIDIEPNAASDACDQIIIQNNTIVLSSAYAGVRSGGINAQAAAGIPHGTNVVIRGNQILGLSSINWPSVPALTTAIGTHGIDGLTISDNSVMGAWGTTISSIHCRDEQISGNHLVGTVDGSGYHLALTLTSVANAIITGNSVNEVFEYDSDTGAGEDEEKIPATSSGSVITAPVYNGYKYYDFDVGHNVFFNGNTYTISAYSNITQNLTVTVPVGTVSTKTWAPGNVTTGVGTSSIAITAHGYNTGAEVTLSTTGVLPAHTPPSTFPSFDGVRYYFIIRVDANTIKLANSLANALAGIAIDFTDTGSGTATITPMIETRFSSNTYHDNFFPDGYVLYPYGISQIGSTALDGVITSIADATYTAKNSDGTIVYTSLTTGRTVNLPDARFCKGKQIVVKDGAGSAGTNNITLDGFGSQTIDGSATKLISTNYGAITIKSDGANWLTPASASGGLSIGSPVTGGAASRVLFEDSSQNLATSSIFGFNPGGSGIFNVGTFNSASIRIQPDYGILFEDSANQWLRMGSSSQVTWDVAANGVSLTPDIGMGRFAVGVAKLTNGSTGIKSLFGGGAAVASATALPLPTGSVFHVTGTTTITSIVATNLQAGVEITLIFDGALTLTDGGNLKLAGNFVTTADDTIKLVYDGSNFYEIARSVN
jgi:hypothetical protein